MGCSVILKYTKNALAARAPPGPYLGHSGRSPDLLVGWGGGHKSKCTTPAEKRVAAENFGFCIHSNR